jgi:hypothetical protein
LLAALLLDIIQVSGQTIRVRHYEAGFGNNLMLLKVWERKARNS